MNDPRITVLDDQQLALVAGGVFMSLRTSLAPAQASSADGTGSMVMNSFDSLQQRWADAVAQQQAAMEQMAAAAENVAHNAA